MSKFTRTLTMMFASLCLACALSTTGGVMTAKPAEAGIVSSIKGAAKAVGRAAVKVEKSAVKGVVTGAKAVGRAGERVGKGLASDAKMIGRGISKSAVGDAARSFGRNVASGTKTVVRVAGKILRPGKKV